MRLLHTFHNDQDARTFANFLAKRHIETRLELDTHTDWGSSEYGTLICHLWVIDEEDAEEANKWLQIFLQDPEGPLFASLRPKTSLLIQSYHDSLQQSKQPQPTQQRRKAPWTFYLIIVCTLLLIFSNYSTISSNQLPEGVSTPVFTSPVQQELFYDYPHAYELVSEFITRYGYNRLKNPETLPKPAYALLLESQNTPYWTGLYPKIVHALAPSKEVKKPLDEPMFEKIRRGEVWRLFSPALLHSGLFHLFFNMMWLLVLGTQMEQRLGGGRYLLFILLTGIFSNTAQYLMNGPNFLGFSGILCAMILFVWIRQKDARWEGYHLLPPTMVFVSIMILGFAAMQFFSFLLEITGQPSFGTGIANTAHLSGALAGYALAKLDFFRAK